MQRLFSLAPGLGVLLAALSLAGCTASSAVPAPGLRFIIFLDQTASIDAAQRAYWTAEADRLATRLAGGSSIAIYPIHDQTMDAAPLFEAEIPALADDATSDIAEGQHLALIRARAGAKDAIERGLSEGGAARTDIFSTVDRIHPDSRQRHTLIFYFSDMLNSTPDLNMEVAGSLTRSTITPRLQNLAKRHYWRQGQLAGAEIYCLLNSVESGHRGPAVDRLTQKAFYDALFNTLGAHLAVYDTHLTDSIFSIPGGSDVASR